MKLVVLGAGQVLHDIVKKLHTDQRFDITAIGVDSKNYDQGRAMVDFARTSGIEIIASLDQLSDLHFDYVFMLNYPQLIQKQLLSKYNFINIHYAPLPRYRGFHGLVWSIINGEKETGYTIHHVEEGIDNGAIYYQYLTSVTEQDNINTILERIQHHLVDNIDSILREIHNGKAPTPQEESSATYVTRRRPKDGIINWQDTSRNIHNLVRALTPPYTKGAFTFYKGQPLYLVKTVRLNIPDYIGPTGKVVNIEPAKGVWVKTGDSAIMITDVVYQGRRLNSSELIKKVGVLLGANAKETS